MAGLDGIKKQIEPPKPIDEDLYELHDERKKSIKTVPGSLGEALDALEKPIMTSCSKAMSSPRT